MESFSPHELMRLVGRGDDSPLAPIPAHLTHAEKVALRRARIEAIDRAQAATEHAVVRPSEAQTRGFGRRPASAKPQEHRAPGDEQKATQQWLRDHLSGLYRIGPVWAVSEARAGHPRYVWRAAIAGVLTRSREDMRSPEWAIARLVQALVAGEIEDPRKDACYRSWPNWPKPLYQFALVAIPERYQSKRSNNDASR